MTAIPAHDFWQTLYPPGTFANAPDTVFTESYPAALPDGRQILLPIRILPGDGTRAVASLIVNQASFEVEDALTEVIATNSAARKPEIVIGVPTLGLPLANGVARRLGHARMVALGTSRKFWYDEALSEPLKSITTPDGGKRIYLDPRMHPLLEGRRILLVDDVVSSGASLAAVLRLLDKAGLAPVAIAVAMEQGDRWKEILPADALRKIKGAFRSPLLRRAGDGWVADMN